jgi:DNA-binding MarR family transcriptional regulator
MNRSSLPTLDCMCAGFRRTARALTQLYEQTFRPLGLRASQFTILQVLARAGEVSQGRLGKILAMDSTTLTRTLKIMRQQRWVAERRGRDRRERLLSLSKGGAALLALAEPEWKKVQARLSQQLGQVTWENLARTADQVATLALGQTESSPVADSKRMPAADN